jgi:hypothetical protein
MLENPIRARVLFKWTDGRTGRDGTGDFQGNLPLDRRIVSGSTAIYIIDPDGLLEDGWLRPDDSMSGYSSSGRTECLPVDAQVRPDDFPAEGAYISRTKHLLVDGTFRPSVQVIACQGTLQVEEYPVWAATPGN